MKARRHMLDGLVYDRLIEAVDIGSLCDLQRDLMQHATLGDATVLTPERAALVSKLLRRGWRRLGKNVLANLVEANLLPFVASERVAPRSG